MYGVNCSKTCECQDSVVCDHVNGKCHVSDQTEKADVKEYPGDCITMKTYVLVGCPSFCHIGSQSSFVYFLFAIILYRDNINDC